MVVVGASVKADAVARTAVEVPGVDDTALVAVVVAAELYSTDFSISQPAMEIY